MITTPDLINSLAANLAPVRRLRPPVARAASWLLLAVLVLSLLAVSQGIRSDIALRLQDPAFAVGIAASLMTGVLAAVAAFVVSLPDRSRLWLLLPVPALVAWLSTIGYQCLTHWVSFDPNGISLGETARCFATLVLTSLPLSLAMLVMLRYAAPLRPTAVALTGSLAVAAITATALSLFHSLDATAMILMWNLATTALFVGLGGLLTRRMFSWVAPRPQSSGRA
ncbi:MAG: NrsF family protein [Hyphomicrobiales bacterium]